MTDSIEDLELFTEAKATFPDKYDLRDRLVLIWPTGKSGVRKGENDTYPWYETWTLVLDDPKGAQDWNGRVMDLEKGAERDTLIPSVVRDGLQLLEGIQYSSGGLTARLKPMVVNGKPKTYTPMLGRLDIRPNQKKGMAPPFSITEPTEADKALVLKHAARVREIMGKLKEQVEGPADGSDIFE